jgi:hypothetical protein
MRTVMSKKRHQVHSLDLSDPKQRAFVATMVNRAGRTPDVAPQLHKMLAATAVAHAAKKPLGKTILQQAAPSADTIYDYVDVLNISATPASGGENYTAEGVISLISGSYYNVVNSFQIYDAVTNLPIGPLTQLILWPGNQVATISATGTRPSGNTDEVYALLTSVVAPSNSQGASAEDAGNVYTSQLEADDPPANPPVVTAPVQQNGVQNRWPGGVKVCLGRGETSTSADCDYCIPNCTTPNRTPPPAQLGLAGNVAYSSAIVPPTSSNATINAFIMPSSGGTCTLGPTGDMFSALTISPPYTTLNWNYNPTPSFGTPCWASGQTVYISWTLVVQEQSNPSNTVDINVNNVGVTTCPPQGGQTPNATPFCPVMMVWGCLAAESPVKLAGGKTKPISEIRVGDKIIADAAGTQLTVSDTVIGTEHKPMIRIVDQAGHHLLVTDGHPVMTPSGVMLAKELQVGQAISTESGPSKIVSLAREPYAGKVYNLIVGVGDAELQRLRDDNRTMIAGGFVVGDNVMQRSFGQKFNARPVNVRAMLPPRWQHDYDTWLAAQTTVHP